jgi:hypothetical protein
MVISARLLHIVRNYFHELLAEPTWLTVFIVNATWFARLRAADRLSKRREARSVGFAGRDPIAAPAFVGMLFLCVVQTLCAV